MYDTHTGLPYTLLYNYSMLGCDCQERSKIGDVVAVGAGASVGGGVAVGGGVGVGVGAGVSRGASVGVTDGVAAQPHVTSAIKIAIAMVVFMSMLLSRYGCERNKKAGQLARLVSSGSSARIRT